MIRYNHCILHGSIYFLDSGIQLKAMCAMDENQDIESAAITFFTQSCCIRYGLGYRLSRTDEHQIRLSVNLAVLNP